MHKIELLQLVNSIGLYTIIITEDACSVLDLTILTLCCVQIYCEMHQETHSIHLLKQKTEDTCINKQIYSNLQVRYK